MLTTFPLHKITPEKKCACGDDKCADAGKHPAVKWRDVKGVNHSEGDPYGIATGTPSGCFVVDLDGEEGISSWLHRGGTLDETVRVATGRGFHLYYLLPDFRVGNRASVLPKVDIRGEGGFVVGPGSPHRNGSTYDQVKNGRHEPSHAPAWLLTLLQQKAERTKGLVTPVEGDAFVRNLTLGKKYLVTEALPCICGNGWCHSRLLIAASYLAVTLQLPTSVVATLLVSTFLPRGNHAWSEDEILHKIDGALENAEQHRIGVPSEGWLQSPQTAFIEQVKAAAGKVTTRRVPDPKHVYTYEIGTPPGSDLKKMRLSDVVFTLVHAPEWSGVWQYDVFEDALRAVDPPVRLDAETRGLSDKDITAVRQWFEHKGFLVGKEECSAAVNSAVDACHYHPVREYLEGLPEGDPIYLDTLAARLLGAQTETENEFLKKWLVSAVRRIWTPGVKADCMLILHGGQGVRKSTFLQTLFNPWFTDQLPDLHGRDASHALEGRWGIEMPELDKILLTDRETVKSYLARQTDKYRQFGTRAKVYRERECVFAGSTNDLEILRDPSGDRRFWPILVTAGKIQNVNRDEIWAAAVAVAGTSYPHHFEKEDGANEIRENFRQLDPWHDLIEDYCRGRERVRTSDIWLECIATDAKDASKLGRREQLRMSDTLRRLGCANKAIHGTRFWEVPESLHQTTPSDEEQRRRRVANSLFKK